MTLVHPDLANLEQFYVRTRAEVTAGRMHGQDGIARVQANTITDATGRVWAVDPMSPDPNRAVFKAALPGQMPVVTDPSSYQPAGAMPGAGSMGGVPMGVGSSMGMGGMDAGMGGPPPMQGGGPFSATMPAASFPQEPAEKKSRFKRDKSALSVRSGGSPLAKLTALPRWVWIAGALAVLLLLVALQVLGGAATPTSTTAAPDTTAATGSTTPSDSTLPSGTTVPGATTTLPGGPATTGVPLVPGELSQTRVKFLIALLETLDVSRAQEAVIQTIDPVAFATFIGNHQAGQRLTITADPVELVGTPAATATITKTAADGATLATAAVVLVKDPNTQEWVFRELPSL